MHRTTTKVRTRAIEDNDNHMTSASRTRDDNQKPNASLMPNPYREQIETIAEVLSNQLKQIGVTLGAQPLETIARDIMQALAPDYVDQRETLERCMVLAQEKERLIYWMPMAEIGINIYKYLARTATYQSN